MAQLLDFSCSQTVGRLGGRPSTQSTSEAMEVFISQRQQGATVWGLQMAVGTSPSFSSHPALALELLPCEMYPSVKAAQGTLGTSSLVPHCPL